MLTAKGSRLRLRVGALLCPRSTVVVTSLLLQMYFYNAIDDNLTLATTGFMQRNSMPQWDSSVQRKVTASTDVMQEMACSRVRRAIRSSQYLPPLNPKMSLTPVSSQRSLEVPATVPICRFRACVL